MKFLDSIIRFPSALNPRAFGTCRLRLFHSEGATPAVLLTDLGELSSGVSITNSIETVIREIFEVGLVLDKSALFIEHYESVHGPETFDLVNIPETGFCSWQSIGRVEAKRILGCDDSELSSSIEGSPRLLNHATQLYYEIRSNERLTPRVSSEKLNRQLQIEKSKLTKSDVLSLVEAGSTENELRRLLSRDPSFLGDAFSELPEEYILFSEFPIGDGFVDYVLFTGRSRMDVLLIEIKGADFNFQNTSGYRALSSRINEAAHQLRVRCTIINDSLDEHRKKFHALRSNVENGAEVFKSFSGPETPLQVDPEKSINIRCVIIGGRMQDDREESLLRHEFESHFIPRLRVDSWDSLLKRIRRR
jgi:Domain of unknown function (DUF4263)